MNIKGIKVFTILYIIVITLGFLTPYVLAEDFKLMPLKPANGDFETQEYNYKGLVTQILVDRMVISGIEFTFPKPMITISNNKSKKEGEGETEIKTISRSSAALPASTPLYEIPGLTIRDKNGKLIYIEELKKLTPAMIKFYSKDFSFSSDGPFSISKILVEEVIPTDIPDSLYNNRQGLSPYEKYKESRPK